MLTRSRLSITTKVHSPDDTKHRLPPIHPGEMLREEFLVPMGLSANALAIAIASSGHAGWRDCERTAGNYRGHGASAGPLLSYDS